MVARAMGESGLNFPEHITLDIQMILMACYRSTCLTPGYQLGAERRAKYGLRSNELIFD